MFSLLLIQLSDAPVALSPFTTSTWSHRAHARATIHGVSSLITNIFMESLYVQETLSREHWQTKYLGARHSCLLVADFGFDEDVLSWRKVWCVEKHRDKVIHFGFQRFILNGSTEQNQSTAILFTSYSLSLPTATSTPSLIRETNFHPPHNIPVSSVELVGTDWKHIITQKRRAGNKWSPVVSPKQAHNLNPGSQTLLFH
jgi:hypothetical protein